MTYTKFARFMIAIVSLCCVSADVLGQSVLDEKLVVAADIRPLDATCVLSFVSGLTLVTRRFLTMGNRPLNGGPSTSD